MGTGVSRVEDNGALDLLFVRMLTANRRYQRAGGAAL